MRPNRVPRHRDDAVAFGGPAQIGDERQDLPREIGAGGRRLDLGDIRVDMADRERPGAPRAPDRKPSPGQARAARR